MFKNKIKLKKKKYIPWRRAWQPTPVFLPGESHGQTSLSDYSPWSWKESNATEWLTKFHLTWQVYTLLLKGIFWLVFQTTACLVLIWLFWFYQSPLLDRLPFTHLSLYTGRTQDYSTFLFCSLNSFLGDL